MDDRFTVEEVEHPERAAWKENARFPRIESSDILADERVICGFCESEECVKADNWPDDCPAMQPLDPGVSQLTVMLEKIPAQHLATPLGEPKVEAAGIEPARRFDPNASISSDFLFDDVLGHRLASIVDGGGCFSIRSNRAKKTPVWSCAFTLKMRADDEVFVRNFHERLGIGTVVFQKECRADGHSRKPNVRWSVHDKVGCMILVQIFDHYPLWSKKREDYAIWRQAVIYWNLVGGPTARNTDWAPMRRLRGELTEVRRYRRAA